MLESITQKNIDEAFNEPLLIASAAGKGGVGKTSVSINLAHALADHGLIVGYIDANLRNPDGASRCYADAGLRLDEIGRATIPENKPTLLDVVLGKKVLTGRKKIEKEGTKSGRGYAAVFRWDRASLNEVAMQSINRPNLFYFFAPRSSIGSLDERANLDERERALNEAQKNILEKSRRLNGYQALVVDFPVLNTHFEIDSFFKCDKKLFIVHYGDNASKDWVYDCLKFAVNKENIRPQDNFIVFNKIKQESKIADRRDFFNQYGLGNIFDWFRDYSWDKNRNDAQEMYELQLPKDIRKLNLDRLAFVNPAFYFYLTERIEISEDRGTPFLSDIKNMNTVYGDEMNALASYLISSRINGYKEKNQERK
ncbi:P-loop NTPase [Candidatus Woesearchaeota archaeon]|nr:P-loop NTPase [Candidatus Woesearchaeota archaeon]